MLFDMKSRLLSALVLLGATSASSVTLHDSNVTFRRALSQCPGALGTVTFALAHARIATHEGVTMETTEGDEVTEFSVRLRSSDGNKSANIEIDQRRRSVEGKDVRATLNRSVACIFPD